MHRSNLISRVWALALVGVLTIAGFAPNAMAQSGKVRLGVLKVEVGPSLQAVINSQGGDKALSVGRVREALDSLLIDRLNSTRKFELVARSDLETLLKEVDVQKAFAENPVQAFKLANCQYGVIVTIDDFVDRKEEKVIAGRTYIARTVRMSAVAKIYDIERGTLAESVDIQIDPDRTTGNRIPGGRQDAGDEFGEKLRNMAAETAERAAMGVLDITFPAKVMRVSGSRVIINRGQGTGIKEGQVWSVWVMFEDEDPDTGEIISIPFDEVGKVKIERVTAQIAMAQMLDDLGIEKDCVLLLEKPAPGEDEDD